MSAQIRRKNDRSKLIERDYARRFYADDAAYPEAMKQTTQKHMDTLKLIKHSAFKKPYVEDGYVPMEYLFNPFPPYAPPNPGDSVVPDCRVGFEASGVLEDWRKCAPDYSCSAYIFTCAHKLISVTCVNCTIASLTPLEGDRLQVIVCSDEDKIDIKAQTIQDPSKPPTWQHFIEERVCCPTTKTCNGKCDGCPPPTIGYTSQQMSCGGTQTLTHSGGGAGGKYTWSADFGTFSTPTGTSVVYTAPAANAECASNPTITLTDCCGHKATLKLAVNCHPVGSNPCGAGTCAGVAEPYASQAASGATECNVVAADNCGCRVPRSFYGCNGTLQCAGGYAGGIGSGISGCQACKASYPPLVCDIDLCSGCSDFYVDTRTACMKTAGCCPEQAL